MAEARRRTAPPWLDGLWIVLGCLAMAASFRLFLNPNGLVLGGVPGLSTIAERLSGIEAAWFQWGINLPLLALGFRLLGRDAALRSVLGSLLLPLAILLARALPPLTDNLLLASVFGGLLYGGGLGLIFQGGGSVGGFSLASQMIARRTGLGLTAILFVLDSLTILAAAAWLGAERALFGLIGAFAMRRAVDAVLGGFNDAQVALVVAKEPDTLRDAILAELDRGVTLLDGRGGFTGEPRGVLLVVLGHGEVALLRALVRRCDPDAFVILMPATEVLGKGFRRRL